jgi:hypothetical protein
MRDDNKDKDVIVMPYKDAHLDYIISEDDLLEWLKDPELKENVDKCLNELR